jgi:transitional endoplasmic reticulum ATPase
MGKNDTPTRKLKVTEALSKDMGRAFARIGPEDLEKLDASTGDIVEVTGKRATVCKAMPAYKELRGQSRIQLDGLSRQNARAGLDENVVVKKISCRPAERLILTPTNVTPSERDLNYIGSRLDGLPVVAGDSIRASLFGSRSADFKVAGTVPREPVIIVPTTELVIGSAEEAGKTRTLSYEDIGGRWHQLHFAS